MSLSHHIVFDNLSSAYGSMKGIINAKASESCLNISVFWNHEEVGSGTREGALSSFFMDCYSRICHGLGVDDEAIAQLKQKSFCLSIDAAHAYHPSYKDKYDPEHQPLMGEGVVIKFNANMRYATDANSSAVIKKLCKKLKLKCQSYVTRSDLPCGSTIGPLFAQTTGIPTVDIGVAELSMHAAREVLSIKDQMDLTKLITGAFNGVL